MSKVQSIKKPFSLIRDKGACLKFDCKNRDAKCKNCIRINGKDSEYASTNY